MSNRPDDNLLTAALATPEDGVAKPARNHPASVITQLTALRVGECWSRVLCVPPNTPVHDVPALSKDMRDQLRNAVNSSLRVAKLKTNGEYTTETADIIGASGGIYIGVIVQRVG